MLRLRYHFFYISIITAGLLASCSAERKNILSKTYHNTTARYNAYFYAKENIREIEKVLDDSYDNDYNDILNIYPEIDSVLAKTYEDKVEECIKKASIAIQRHKNSKWVDDSYILIGLARFYSTDYVNAIETFKYVNTKSEDPDARHRALVHLLRTFTDYKEYNNATSVSDYLKKEKVNKNNQKFLYINRAHYYQIQEDYDNMVQNLVKAAPILKKKDGKGRIYFIIGQVYQMLGFDAEAFNYYKRCIASNPEYELDFHARLYMAQVTELGKSSDLKSARKLFKKLLKDKKNKEFKDKIYYEMAAFEMRQNNLEDAVKYLKESVKASTNNNRQKGQSYLKLGEIHYDSLRKYELAKAYYDSTITVLPKDYENYELIKERQEVLSDFVKQLNTIHLQDSLLALSEMDSLSIRKQIDEYIAAEEERKKQEEEKERKRIRRNTFNQLQDNTGFSSTSWYFDNPSAIAMGQTEFKRIWGDRQLEDNWRRSNKEAEQDYEEVAKDNTNTSPDTEDIEVGEEDPETVLTAQAEKMYNQIPFSAEAKERALTEIEEAYYNLGNIYYFNLHEEPNAATSFETLLRRFPETKHEPEVLYHLYLINKSLGRDTERYKNRLLSQYPNTTYAKLLANPNYTEESTAANEQLKKAYKKAYELFGSEQYTQALDVINQAMNDHQETVFTPRLKLLKILITGKTEDVNLYQYQLTEFIKEHPDSEITPYAKELLTASENFLKKQRRLLGTEFVKYFDQEHYLVVVYDAGKGLTDRIYPLIEAYNNSEFDEQNLKTSNLILDENRSITMITSFGGQQEALQYFRKFVSEDVISEKTQNSKIYKFVITKDNFNIFYQSKDLEAYLRFFDKNYKNGL
ncbi:tetratricopeptide repeat protein [Fulvivirga ulvae]|uniref:type IX secretion system periplasmic lipoprotein PorW/SprE n=1 Tax=Fulvivirga ulvae TaxID=2904245 RepID=UPI001F3BA319|nr:tetratricopeptide repeat protein [Fulvivirga ulvae]UII34232.1 tetratricopeptide repeat protein [Fulvivirga ulvae]